MSLNRGAALSITVLALGLAGCVRTTPASDPNGVPYDFAFDHVGVYVDAATLEALASSSLLADEFANGGLRSSRIENLETVGFYLNGELTYLEFVREDGAATLGVKAGDGMIAFNAEAGGSVDWLAEYMASRHPESNPKQHLRYIEALGERFPYSHTGLFEYETGHEGFGAWAMEYHHDFKHRMTGGRFEPGDITRVKDTPRVAHHPDKYFRDVVSVTVAMTETRRVQLVELLRAMGYEIDQRDGATICRGAENIVELVPRSDEVYAIQRIAVSLMRPKEGKRLFHFGPDITLRFSDGPEAEWTFGAARKRSP